MHNSLFRVQLLALVLLLASCGIFNNVVHPLPPPPVCATPLDCIRVNLVKGTVCDDLWVVSNDNPSKWIRAYFHTIKTEVNQGASVETPDIDVTRDVEPKKEIAIRCRVEQTPTGKQNIWRYKLFKAEFIDVNGNPVDTTLVDDTITPDSSALTEIYGDKDNMENPVLEAMWNFAYHCVKDDAPIKPLKLSLLFSPWKMDRDTATIKGDEFLSLGSEYVSYMTFPPTNAIPTLTSAAVKIPAWVQGVFSRNQSKDALIEFTKPETAVQLTYFDSNHQKVGVEYIKTIQMNDDTMVLTGSSCFRFKIKFKPPY